MIPTRLLELLQAQFFGASHLLASIKECTYPTPALKAHQRKMVELSNLILETWDDRNE